jgi:hypothetical protein
MAPQFYRIRAADRPGFLNKIKAQSSLTGDGAAAYLIRSTGTKLRAHVGNGFRAPSLFERFGEGVFQNVPTRFGDRTLRAEQSIGVDAGIDQHAANDRLLLGVTYFYTRLQRVIDFKSLKSVFNPNGDPDPWDCDGPAASLTFPEACPGDWRRICKRLRIRACRFAPPTPTRMLIDSFLPQAFNRSSLHLHIYLG